MAIDTPELSRKPSEPRDSVGSRLFRVNWYSILIVIGLTAALVFVMGDVLAEPDNVPGTDTYFHITQIDEGLDRFRDGQSIGPIAESIDAGRAYLYGTESTYPQFAYWVAIVVALLVGSSALAFTSLMFTALLVAQLTFFFGFKSRFGVVPALYGAVAFGYAPFLMTNVLPQGRFPAVLAIALLPLIMSSVMKTLESPDKKWWIIGLVGTAISVAFHPMVFYIGALGIAVIAVAHVLTINTSMNRIGLAVLLIVVGVLVALLALPTGLTSLSAGNSAANTLVGSGGAGVRATTGSDALIVPFSIRWNSFDVGLRSFNENYAGLGLALAGLVTLTFAWRKKVAMFTGSALVLYIFAAGSITPFWNMIPLASALEPRRFLFAGYLALGLAIAFGVSVLIAQMRESVDRRDRAQVSLVLVIVAALLLFDAIPMASRIAPEEREQENLWAGIVEQNSNGGRAFWNAGKDFAPYYYFSRQAGVDTVGRISNVDLAIRQGFPEAALAHLELYDVRAVLTEQTEFEGLVDQLVENGFIVGLKWNTQVLLISDRPGSRVMMPSRNVGLFGVAADRYWSRIIPASISLGKLSGGSLELARSLDAIVLSAYSVSNDSDIEASLTEYVKSGGIVILGEPNLLGDDLFEVSGVQRPVPLTLTLEYGGEMIESLPFEFQDERFSGTFYDNAGEPELIATDASGNVIPVVQKRTLGDGAIYWVCCNFGNHIVEKPGEDFEIAYALRSFFESEIGGYDDVLPAPFDADVEVLGPSELAFDYQSDELTFAVISARPLSQRRVILDDTEELELLAYGPVFAVALPAGEHRVHLTASAPVTSVSVVGVWLLALAATGFVLWWLWGWLSAPPKTAGGFRAAVRRWLSEPPFVRKLAIPGGTVLLCEPRTGKRLDLKTRDGSYVRVESLEDELQVAAVLVELSASEGERVEFDVESLVLSSAAGTNYSVIPAADLQTQELLFPNLRYLLDTKHYLLDSTVVIESSESVRGYVFFEFQAAEEYPFVHDNFVKFL